MPRVNAAAVAVPAQTFEIRAYVALERHVPIMTEFAVRLLRLLGTTTFESLQGYFGLTMAQTRDLVSQLTSEGLVEENNETLCLTSYAVIRLDSSSNESPQFTRIAERVSHPAFDLLTFSPVKRDISTVHGSFAVDLDLSSESQRSDTVTRAERAFIERFHDIERLSNQPADRRAFDVYKVDEITAGRRTSIPVLINVAVDDVGRVDYLFDQDVQLEDALKTRIQQLFADTIGRSQTGRDGFPLFQRLFGGEQESDLFRRDRPFNYRDFLTETQRRTKDSDRVSDTRPIAAAPYLPEAMDQIVRHLGQAYEQFRAVYRNVRLQARAYWFAPKNEFWGRSLLLGEACTRLGSTIKDLMDSERERGQVTLVHGPDPYSTKDVAQRDLALAQAAGVGDLAFVESGLPSSRFEFLLFPGVFAVALCYVNVPGTAGVLAPVGFSTHNLDRLRSIQKLTYESLRTITAAHRRENSSKPLTQVKAHPDSFAYLERLPQDPSPAEGDT